jgi:hypothetical protein
MSDIQLERILRQLADAVGCFDRLHKKVEGQLNNLGDDDLIELHTTLVAATNSLAPPGSAYRQNADRALSRAALYDQAAMLAGVVRSMYAAYLSGFMGSFANLVRADLFDDFLQISDHLLEQGYKDAAAVLAGGVLEEHLRKLCERLGIEILVSDKPKPASRMNDEIAARAGYSKLDAKNVTAWLGLRNSAAHGKYSEYTAEQVKVMILGIRELTARTTSVLAG